MHHPPILASPAMTHFPSPILSKPCLFSDEEKIRLIANHFREIMNILGLDITDESLSKTPERVAKMYVKEAFTGLNELNFPDMSFIKWESLPQMVFIKVSFTSFCEHHFVPMNGFAHIAYLADNQLIGLSSTLRLVRFFASRPQLQERLTAQIADSLAILLNKQDVAVSIHAVHECVRARGIQDQGSPMITNVLRGDFNTDERLRGEFFEAISRA